MRPQALTITHTALPRKQKMAGCGQSHSPEIDVWFQLVWRCFTSKTQENSCAIERDKVPFERRVFFGFLNVNGYGGSLVVFVCCSYCHENESRRLAVLRWLLRRYSVVGALWIPSQFSVVLYRGMESTTLHSQVIHLLLEKIIGKW